MMVSVLNPSLTITKQYIILCMPLSIVSCPPPFLSFCKVPKRPERQERLVTARRPFHVYEACVRVRVQSTRCTLSQRRTGHEKGVGGGRGGAEYQCDQCDQCEKEQLWRLCCPGPGRDVHLWAPAGGTKKPGGRQGARRAGYG